ncbi:MAG: hypothetical protein HRT74_14275, partial [Flavobacteriales bacterium]|nr:hypothetical protein [Flavobacteriales bacterium]
KEKSKPFSNYWFSSSDGHTKEEFVDLISKENVDHLNESNGCCIVYTHFAVGFLDQNGEIHHEFENRMRYLAEQDGWFVPASEILEFLQKRKNSEYTSQWYLNYLDFKWLIERLKKKRKYGR